MTSILAVQKCPAQATHDNCGGRAVDSVIERTKRSDVTSVAPTSVDFATYFTKKVDDVWRSTQNAPSPVFSALEDSLCRLSFVLLTDNRRCPEADK